jgi:hypothetical protein
VLGSDAPKGERALDDPAVAPQALGPIDAAPDYARHDSAVAAGPAAGGVIVGLIGVELGGPAPRPPHLALAGLGSLSRLEPAAPVRRYQRQRPGELLHLDIKKLARFCKTGHPTLPNALVEAMKARPELAFDAIVVDEGQDFQDGWLLALRLCLRDADCGSFYVFFDDNQKVYVRDRGFLAELPQARFHLTRNLPNTKAIHDSSRPWYSSPRISRPTGPNGEAVAWRTAATAKALRSGVAAVLSELLGTHGMERRSIAVLTADAVAGHPLVAGGRICDLPFVAADENSGDSLVFDTVRRFKGLDRPIVIIVDVDRLTDPELIYVALSRPSVLLYVIGPPEDLDRIRSGRSIIAA